MEGFRPAAIELTAGARRLRRIHQVSDPTLGALGGEIFSDVFLSITRRFIGSSPQGTYGPYAHGDPRRVEIRARCGGRPRKRSHAQRQHREKRCLAHWRSPFLCRSVTLPSEALVQVLEHGGAALEVPAVVVVRHGDRGHQALDA
jgi:hypothetical protein